MFYLYQVNNVSGVKDDDCADVDDVVEEGSDIRALACGVDSVAAIGLAGPAKCSSLLKKISS